MLDKVKRMVYYVGVVKLFTKGDMMRLNRFKVLEYMARQRIPRQRALAERIGVTPQALSNWMGGDPFSLENLGALCRELKCTPNDILELPNTVSLDLKVPVPVGAAA